MYGSDTKKLDERYQNNYSIRKIGIRRIFPFWQKKIVWATVELNLNKSIYSANAQTKNFHGKFSISPS